MKNAGGSFALLGQPVSPRNQPEADFDIIIFPDTQNMVRWNQAAHQAMVDWVVANKTALNIRAMLHVGDITDWATQAEWETADADYAQIEATGLPVLYAIGNHDYDNPFNPAPRAKTLFNTYFGVNRYIGKTYYGGTMPGSGSENTYIRFSAGTRKFMALTLEFHPTDDQIAWASGVLDDLYTNEPDVDVIIITHSYINQNGSIASPTDTYSTNHYGMADGNSGIEIYEALIKRKPNIKYVICGHFLIPNVNAMKGLVDTVVSVGDHGNLINQIFVNYQDDNRQTVINYGGVNYDFAPGGRGGNGFLMRMTFSPQNGTVALSFYSPHLGFYDPNQPTIVFADNNGITTFESLGVARDLATKNLRVQGEAKFEALKKMGVPYFDHDSKLRDHDVDVAGNVVMGLAYNNTPFKYVAAGSASNVQPVLTVAGQLLIRSYEGGGTQSNVRAGGVFTSTYFGTNALRSHLPADHFQNYFQNSAFGFAAMQNANGASNNDAFGGWSLGSLVSGAENSAFGRDALGKLTTGSSNVAVGLVAGYDLLTGIQNVFLGRRTGRGITTGNNNIVIGDAISGLPAALENTTIIGGVAGAVETRDNMCSIGKSTQRYSYKGIIPEYADQAAAVAGGLLPGDKYHTGGTLKIVLP